MVLPPSEVKDRAGVKGLNQGHIQRPAGSGPPSTLSQTDVRITSPVRTIQICVVTADNIGVTDAVECAVGRVSLIPPPRVQTSPQ